MKTGKYWTLLNCTVAFRVFVVDNGSEHEFGPPTRPHAAAESIFYTSTLRSRAVTEPTTFWLQNNKTKPSLPSLITGVDASISLQSRADCLENDLKGERAAIRGEVFLTASTGEPK